MYIGDSEELPRKLNALASIMDDRDIRMNSISFNAEDFGVRKI